ncbi:MAG: hypothetical protein KGQ58_09220 [Proteobacteria bacterium]|nr:hypothetical protein [Pseudomonadota bacterium]
MLRLLSMIFLGLTLELATLASTVFADTLSSSSANSPAPATNEQQLITRYSALFGSEENAQAAIEGLLSGHSFLLTDEAGGSVLVSPPQPHMSYGNINIALALAQSELAQAGISDPDAMEIKTALTGGSIDNWSTPGVLTLRSQHMGWGVIAKRAGLNLGLVMKKVEADSDKSVSNDETIHHSPSGPSKLSHAATVQKPDIPPMERPEIIHPERVAIPHIETPGR